MKSVNLFTRFFSAVVLLTMGSLALSAFSAKKAYEADPELLAKVENKFHIQVQRGGFYWNSSSDRSPTQDSWQLPGYQQKIHIKSFGGRLALKGTSSHEILISANGQLNKAKSSRLLEVTSTEAELTIAEPEGAVSDLEVHIEIPDSLKNELMIESINGDISIENLSPTVLTVVTVSGNLVLDSIKADGVNFSPISGDSQIKDSSIKTMTGRSVSGKIEIENSESTAVHLKSISGDIDLKLPKAESFHFDLTTISGGIRNEHVEKADASATIDISTTSGDIEIE